MVPGRGGPAGRAGHLAGLVGGARPDLSRWRHDVRAPGGVGPGPLPRPGGHVRGMGLLPAAQGRREALVRADRAECGAGDRTQAHRARHGRARLRRPGAADAPGGPSGARGRQVAGARHGQGGARRLRHLHAREQRLHVICGGHRLDEPEPGAFPAAPGGGGPRAWSLEGCARYPARQAPGIAGHLQRGLQDLHVRGRVLPERRHRRGAHQGRRVGRLLPGRADRDRELGGFRADDA